MKVFGATRLRSSASALRANLNASASETSAATSCFTSNDRHDQSTSKILLNLHDLSRATDDPPWSIRLHRDGGSFSRWPQGRHTIVIIIVVEVATC